MTTVLLDDNVNSCVYTLLDKYEKLVIDISPKEMYSDSLYIHVFGKSINCDVPHLLIYSGQKISKIPNECGVTHQCHLFNKTNTNNDVQCILFCECTEPQDCQFITLLLNRKWWKAQNVNAQLCEIVYT